MLERFIVTQSGAALHSSFQQGGGYSRNAGDAEVSAANDCDTVVDAAVKRFRHLNRTSDGSALRRLMPTHFQPRSQAAGDVRNSSRLAKADGRLPK